MDKKADKQADGAAKPADGGAKAADRLVTIRIFNRDGESKEEETSLHASLCVHLARDPSLWNDLLPVYIDDHPFFQGSAIRWIQTVITLDSAGVVFKNPPLLPLTDIAFLELTFKYASETVAC